MSTEPVSGSPYIIICNGRIEVAAVDGNTKKIIAASRCAAQLVSFIESQYDVFDPHDCQAISTLQHQLMDHILAIHPLTGAQIHQKIDALFNEFHALEDKY